mgnify:CR=1 FL=1
MDSGVDVFSGQPKNDGISFRVDPGRQVLGYKQGMLTEGDDAHDAGLRNAEIVLSREQLLDNVRAIQRAQNLPLAEKLTDSRAAPGAPNLDIEMETGTGKT